jgi:hypothetical protein
MHKCRFTNRRAGITLLEVLISIGLLAIGLVATLSLIPAGGTYLRKADIDDRAAALIPQAMNAIESTGLLREDALYWESNQSSTEDGEPDLPPVGQLHSETPPTFADVLSWYPSWDDPPSITGTAEPGAVINIVAKLSPDDAKVVGPFPVTTGSSGRFSLVLEHNDLVGINPPRMTVFTNQPNLNEPNEYFDAWEFEAAYSEPPPEEGRSDISPLTVTPPLQPARLAGDTTPTYRHYYRRRRLGYQRGDAIYRFTYDPLGDQPEFIKPISFPTIQYIPDGWGRLKFTHKSEVRVSGKLWRVKKGYKRGNYFLYDHYLNANNENPDALKVPPSWRQDRPSTNDADWVDSTGDPITPEEIADDEDGFQFPIREGQVITIRDESVPGALDLAVTDGEFFPLYFDGQLRPEWLLVSGPGRKTYRAEADATVTTKIKLKTDAFGVHHYSARLTIYGNTRLAVIDPLMTSHIDRAVAGNLVPGLIQPNREPNKYFAEFAQRLNGGSSVTMRIPRLSWSMIADRGANLSLSVALAEKLCRPFDTIEVSPPVDETLAPEPLFDGSVSPLRRRSQGKMSWLLTIQPENNGSIEYNWASGNMFDVSLVIFDERIFPREGDDSLIGEYVFQDGVQWRPSTGEVAIPIPSDMSIDPDDLLRMFRPGAWIMLAPKNFSYDQKIEWIQIQTSELRKDPIDDASKMFVVPAKDLLLRTDGPTDLVALVYQGVVAVARRSVRIE